MKIKHHLTDQLIAGYAAGILPEAMDLIVAAHISLCDTCRATLGSFEAVGATVFNDAGDVAMSPDSLEQTLVKIDMSDAPKKPVQKSSGILPNVLKDYIGGDVDTIKWHKLGMGVKQSILKTSGGASARLLHIEAGCKVPDHGHRGTELTLVLQGAFSDEVDHFERGDIEVADEDLEHTPWADAGEPCICLAVTDAPLRFNALMPRLFQPLFRI